MSAKRSHGDNNHASTASQLTAHVHYLLNTFTIKSRNILLHIFYFIYFPRLYYSFPSIRCDLIPACLPTAYNLCLLLVFKTGKTISKNQMFRIRLLFYNLWDRLYKISIWFYSSFLQQVNTTTKIKCQRCWILLSITWASILFRKISNIKYPILNLG